MLISLVITLRPIAPGSLPPMHGPALHAAFFEWLRNLDPTFATVLHDDSGLKPFTISMLQPGDSEIVPLHPTADLVLLPNNLYWFRITALEPQLGALLYRLYMQPPPIIKILGQILRVEALSAANQQHKWAAVTNYADLRNDALRDVHTRNPKLRFHFVAPTTFRSNGRALPVPLPDLVFGSLATRWNAFGDTSLPLEVVAFVRENVLISAYDIRTEMQAMEGSRRESKWVCFRGWCEYTVFSADAAMIDHLQTLARYAFFAGVGYKTTMGFGQVTLVYEPMTADRFAY